MRAFWELGLRSTPPGLTAATWAIAARAEAPLLDEPSASRSRPPAAAAPGGQTGPDSPRGHLGSSAQSLALALCLTFGLVTFYHV